MTIRKRKRLSWSIKEELLEKAREAALSSIKIFNDPLILFKSETFIVLMIIAWTYLLHAYYRSIHVDYRYYKSVGKIKRYDKTKHGSYKHWELERCLNDEKCPIDKNTVNNLKFLIGLRHEIEHQMTRSLDNYLSGRYQACVLNFNNYIKKLFGDKYGLDEYLTYSLQFVEITNEQIIKGKPSIELPQQLQAYIVQFDEALTHEEFNSPEYSFRLVFAKKLVNRPGQADRVIEFIDPKSELAKGIEKEYWVKKEVEKPKYRPSDVVAEINKAGFTKFRVNPEHYRMWKKENAKDPSKGYGVEIQGVWYWYDKWIKRCIELCEEAGNKYK